MMHILVSVLTFLTLIAHPAYAQSAITYPIAELGNCADKSACRIYCADALHHDACTEYGKAKGIIKPQPSTEDKIAAAAKELGCSSPESCKSFCEDPSHYVACDAFAKKNSLSGGYRVSKEKLSGEITQQVSALLGNVCQDYASCKSYCDQPLNRLRCTEVARQLDLKGGIEKRGPGGCTTEATCKLYCSDPSHFDVCKPFVPETIGGTPEPFRGPGGCSTEQACRLYCLQHPESCPGTQRLTPRPSSTVPPPNVTLLRSGCLLPENERPDELKDESVYRKVCVGTPENFSDYAIYCKQFPTRCGSEGYKNFCHDFPDKCGLMEDREAPDSPTPSTVIRILTATPKVEEEHEEESNSGTGSLVLPSPTRPLQTPTKTPTLRPINTESGTTLLNTPTRTPSPSYRILTATPTRSSLPSPTATPTRTATVPPPTYTKAPSPTKLPTYTKTPTIEPTRIENTDVSPTEYRISNSGSGSANTPTPSPAVRGASTIGPFGFLIRFLFGT